MNCSLASIVLKMLRSRLAGADYIARPKIDPLVKQKEKLLKGTSGLKIKRSDA